MNTSKLLGFFAALFLLVSVSSCSTYYTRPANYGRHYGYRRPVPPPPAPRPYGCTYGYGRPGW